MIVPHQRVFEPRDQHGPQHLVRVRAGVGVGLGLGLGLAIPSPSPVPFYIPSPNLAVEDIPYDRGRSAYQRAHRNLARVGGRVRVRVGAKIRL